MEQLLLGNCLEKLKELPENSVDSIVTDPPYGLEFMGKDWDKGVPGVHFWEEMIRVLKPGGHLLAFSGTRTYHRMAVAIEDAGFEVRDMIEWVYGSGFPKSLNVQKQLQKMNNDRADEFLGVGTALKPAHEPICMARKPLAEKKVAENVLKWETGGINIEQSRVDGKRFPANLIHDNSEEVRECFPEQKGSIGRANRKTAGKYNASSYKVGVVTETEIKDSGNASRFFKSIVYISKASKAERNRGCEGFETKQSVGGGGGIGDYLNDVNSASGKFGSEKAPAKNNHPTVKPIALMEYLITMVTPPKGTTLDPFMGSGSTGVAAINLDRGFIGIEMEPEYMKIAKARVEHAKKERGNMLF